MEKIAWINGNICVYWTDIVILLASAAAVFAFLALYRQKEGKLLPALGCLVAAVPMSLLLSRLAHWYFRPEGYGSLAAALNPEVRGGFALMGVFAGCFLAACLVRMLRLTRDLPGMLDSLSLAGCFGIALGRTEAFFSNANRGMILPEGFPIAAAVINPVSGSVEWRLATFLLQAGAAGILFLGLFLFYVTGSRKKGDTTLLFLMFYGAIQIILDSTRYDAMCLRSNGFIRAVQVLGAAALVIGMVVFAVRLLRAGGWSKWYLLLWIMQVGCLGLAGYMEYHVQRHADQAVFAYSVMAAALADILIIALMTRHLAGVEARKHAEWISQMEADLAKGI